MILWSLLLLAGVASDPAGSETAVLQGLFRSGIEAYDSQDYDRAIERWLELRRFRVESAALEYNLGNAYFKRREYGRAVLHWERALRLDPDDREARDNLGLVRGMLVDEVPGQDGLLAGAVAGLRRWVPLEAAVWLAIGLWLALGGVALVAQLSAGATRRLALAAVLVSSLAVAVVAPLAWLEVRAAEDHERWVVLAPAVDARSGPGEQYTTVFTVHEGLVVRRRGSASGWERVRLPNGLDGWVPAATVERI